MILSDDFNPKLSFWFFKIANWQPAKCWRIAERTGPKASCGFNSWSLHWLDNICQMVFQTWLPSFNEGNQWFYRVSHLIFGGFPGLPSSYWHLDSVLTSTVASLSLIFFFTGNRNTLLMPQPLVYSENNCSSLGKLNPFNILLIRHSPIADCGFRIIAQCFYSSLRYYLSGTKGVILVRTLESPGKKYEAWVPSPENLIYVSEVSWVLNRYKLLKWF